ncbi:MAG: LptF/LptG family permease, partial [Proteobacteria bacterium]|nr:LptF/LptG family permease [Pseudomonadota bacterium]
ESGDDENSSWDILSAKSATIQENPETHERFVILKSGYRYQGTPGQKNYNVVKFSEYDLRIPEGKTSVRHEEKILPTDVLFPLNNKNLLYAAELQWRLALPISVLLLGFLAIPLSEIKPRQGKYASFLPAAVIYVIYANLLFVSRTWIVKGQISPLLGMWWLHASIFSLGLLLLFFPDIKRFFKRRG